MMVQEMIKLSKFDVADYLDSQETIIAYLNEALELGDADFIYHALETIARAKGMTDFCQRHGHRSERHFKARVRDCPKGGRFFRPEADRPANSIGAAP
jgi:probable addiction module antidote protein